MNKKQLAKWRKQLRRVESLQVIPLLQHHRLFKQFRDCYSAYRLTDVGIELASWIHTNYLAFALTGIRRTAQERKKGWDSISLVILLRELQDHSASITRDWFRSLYRNSNAASFADSDFAKITRRKSALRLDAKRIDRDVKRITRATEAMKTFVDKQVAHNDWDRRKSTTLTYGKIDRAVEAIREAFDRYYLLLRGIQWVEPPELEEDITKDLQRLWPVN